MNNQTTTAKRLAIMKQTGQSSIDQGLFFITPDSTPFEGSKIRYHGKTLTNLSSCSYLGLELDERLKQAAKDAIDKYGVQYSSCRAFVECPLYAELEYLLESVFNQYVTVNYSTSFGHLAALPVLVEDHSLLVLDFQSHHTLRLSADYLTHRGISSKTIRHNNIHQLEQILDEEPDDRPVWYVIDGLYSMYGDFAPIPELLGLLDRWPNLHLYIDDAHSLSWYGEQGKGYALSCGSHQRMIVAGSLGKAFGTSGGVTLFSDKHQRDDVRLLGGPFYWGSPLTPPVLGAATASARLHLDDTLPQRQQQLMHNVQLFTEQCHSLNIPLIANNQTPIRYIGLGKQHITNLVAKRWMEAGYYASAVCYPSVSRNNTGLRIGITTHLTEQDILHMTESLAEILTTSLTPEDIHVISRSFRRAL